MSQLSIRGRVGLLIAAGFIVSILALRVSADEPNGDANKQPKAQPFPLPDIEKLLPPGIDPQQADALRKQFEMLRKQLSEKPQPPIIATPFLQPDPKQAEDFRKKMEMLRKQLEELQKQLPGGGGPGGFPGFPEGFPNMPGFPEGFPFVNGVGGRENRLGASLERPSAVLIDQLDLPKGQGMVLGNVKANSAAAKAGLKSRDILLELGGKEVSSNPSEFMKALNNIKTDEAVDAVVLRKAKKETIKGLKLPDVPKAPQFPNFPGGLPNIPNLPNFQPGQLPFPPNLFGGGQKATVTMSRNADGSFTGQHQAGDRTITVAGQITDGKAAVKSIEVRDGDKTKTFAGVDEAPEALRDDIRNLIRLSENPLKLERKE